MSAAISIRNLGKRYRVNHAQERAPYRTLRDSLVRAAAAPIRRLRGGTKDASEEFWALKNVDFDVEPGEVLGIVGRNGAGKSTLLKILSRITSPTTGEVAINGRIGSLLEVGTGFHPELTGRENIYMNGSVLGMSRWSIKRSFDAIVGFADVTKFLDTPVKRYSSGMYVRLAFAVAAYLQPEVLIVDEVLAVGDLAFQQKCLGRMRDVSKEGRTVLFVSHNLPAVQSLCGTALLLENGSVAFSGSSSEVISAYCRHSTGSQKPGTLSLSEFDRARRQQAVLQSADLIDASGNPAQYVPLGGMLQLQLHLVTKGTIDSPSIGVAFDDEFGQRLLTVHTPLNDSPIHQINGSCRVHCTIPNFPLAPGEYWVKLAVSARGAEIDSVDKALCLRVVEDGTDASGRSFCRGICVAAAEWRVARG